MNLFFSRSSLNKVEPETKDIEGKYKWKELYEYAMNWEFDVKSDLNKYTRDNYMSVDRKLAMFQITVRERKAQEK